MTDASTTGAVERFEMSGVTDGERAWTVSDPHPDGEWVRFTDYQALIERVEAAEGRVAIREGECQAKAQIISKLEQDRRDMHRRAQRAEGVISIVSERMEAARGWQQRKATKEGQWSHYVPDFFIHDSLSALRRAAPTEGEA